LAASKSCIEELQVAVSSLEQKIQAMISKNESVQIIRKTVQSLSSEQKKDIISTYHLEESRTNIHMVLKFFIHIIQSFTD